MSQSTQRSFVTILLAWLLPTALSSISTCRWVFDSCKRHSASSLAPCKVKLLPLDKNYNQCMTHPRFKIVNMQSNYSRLCNNNFEQGRGQCQIRASWCSWSSWTKPLPCDYLIGSVNTDLKRTRNKCCHPVTGQRDKRIICDLPKVSDRDFIDRKPDDSSRCQDHSLPDDKTTFTLANLISTIIACVSIFVAVVVCQSIGHQMRKARSQRATEIRGELLRGRTPNPSVLPSTPFIPSYSPPAVIAQQPVGDGTVLPPSYEEAAQLPPDFECPPPQYEVALKLVT